MRNVVYVAFLAMLLVFIAAVGVGAVMVAYMATTYDLIGLLAQ